MKRREIKFVAGCCNGTDRIEQIHGAKAARKGAGPQRQTKAWRRC
jgi:hypothetical protein